MKHQIWLKSEIVLELLERGEINTDSVSLYDFQKKKDPTEDDLKLFEILVKEYGSKHRVKNIGWLSEDLGLECLKTEGFYFEDVREYEVPQSHKDFLNSLSDKEKSELKGSFLGTQIDIPFVSRVKKTSLEVKDVEGLKIVLIPTLDYINSFTTLVKNKGFIINSVETANILEELIYQVEVAKEKAFFKNPGSGSYYKFFNMPTIKPIFSEIEYYFSIKGDYYDPIINKNGFIVNGFSLIGNLEEIEYFETVSMYQSDTYQNDFMEKIIKDLGIKSTESTYILKQDKEAVLEEYHIRQKEYQTNGIVEIQEYAKSLGIQCKVETYGLKFYPSILIKEGDFEFECCFSKRYGRYSVEQAKEWLSEFDEDVAKESYEFEKAYEIFLAKDLPVI